MSVTFEGFRISGNMKQLLPILFLFPLLAFILVKKPKLHVIPACEKQLSAFIADTVKDRRVTIPAFEIGELVTLGEYKEYLECVRRDSSEAFYQSQLPDSAIGTPARRKEYLSDKRYEKLPAVGVSWDNAMHYCRWKTLRENPDSIVFIYRLPGALEWLSARSHLDAIGARHDFDGNYSDWTLDPKDESAIDFYNGGFSFSYFYLHEPNDPSAMKRKIVMGSSYLFTRNDDPRRAYAYYADKGYRNIGFRCVKDRVSTSPIVWEQETVANQLIKYWNL